MKNSITIKTTQDIFRLRNFLQQISSISFAFSKLNQKYPIDQISEEEGLYIISVYKDMLKDTEVVIEAYKNINLNIKNGKQNTTNR